MDSPVLAGVIAIRLFMGIKKKRGSLYLLLVPHAEALALPLVVERATQKPTPNMYLPLLANNHIQLWASTVASFLTTNMNLQDSSVPRTKRK